MTPLKQRGKIRRAYIYICYKIEQHDSTKIKGENQMDKYIYTKGEDLTDTYIYTIRLNNRPLLKQRGNIRRTNIYTKGEDQTDKYIYYKIEQDDSSKAKGEVQTDKYIYYKIEQHDSSNVKGEDQTDKYIY